MLLTFPSLKRRPCVKKKLSRENRSSRVKTLLHMSISKATHPKIIALISHPNQRKFVPKKKIASIPRCYQEKKTHD